MTWASSRSPFRDRVTGRYAASRMEVLCVCGHPLGWHSAEVRDGRRDCFAADFSDDVCECERFRKSRRAPAAEVER